MAESESIAGTSNTFPMMPSQESEEWSADVKDSDNQTETTEELTHADDAVPENTSTTEDEEPTHGCEASVTATEPSPITNTPMPTSRWEAAPNALLVKTFGVAPPHHLDRQNGKVM